MMSRDKNIPRPVMPFTGLLVPDPAMLGEVDRLLAERLGPVAMETTPYEWSYSSYYEREMGGSLWRKHIFFSRLIEPGSLKDLKLWSNRLEDEAGNIVGGDLRRRFNIDPGYVDHAKVVLASTKDPGHRIYLGDGIYADALLLFKNGSFRPFDHTYPDMKSTEAIAMFNGARSIYLEIMKGTQRTG